MKREFNNVFQFKISLKQSNPAIWRRIQVPDNYTFWDLHVAIQDVMGWQDYHLHEFIVTDQITKKKISFGIPDEDWHISWDTRQVLPGWDYNTAQYFSEKSKKGEYIYDFGDHWEHTILLEKILPREKGVKYPVCIGGERACPPEDCGGIDTFYEMLEILMDPKHKARKGCIEWLGGEFDPEKFECKKVKFSIPAKRLVRLLGG